MIKYLQKNKGCNNLRIDFFGIFDFMIHFQFLIYYLFIYLVTLKFNEKNVFSYTKVTSLLTS